MGHKSLNNISTCWCFFVIIILATLFKVKVFLSVVYPTITNLARLGI